ncbi:glucosamine-6-phosphate deaminase [Caenibacillus caldisaponilyticus]|uniref:glucosamine-6-phosphate deaminase n=1 Tax=Caenibacillus caldisaponilyticus TaxID=1674942 RepID=UPI0009885DEC|nr:glucosamine-6-phosphate deaminase [Caenibacillus caldisaponilyticus]
MKVIRVKDYQELGKKAAAIIIEHVKAKPDAVLGLATGSTPQTTYRELIRDHKENGTSYRQVTTVNLDEYIGLSPEDPNSYHYFMKKELFEAIDIASENTHLPNGEAADLEAECRRYDDLIRSVGGIDLQLLGIGRNGHIGFNEPGTSFQTRTHVVELAEDTRKANARFFPSLDAVPTSAITMGIQNILESKRILLLASGPAKAEAMARLLNQREITEAFPASCLHLHDDVTVIADEAALSLVD